MRNEKPLVILITLGLALAVPLTALTKNTKESQKGGLPALEDRVELDEGASNWAVVNSDGTLARSSSSAGAVSSSHSGTGSYDVTFAKDVSGCAFNATLGDTSTGVPPVGMIGVAGDVGDVNTVVVQTTNSLGVAADASFHLLVSCPGHLGD